MKLYDYFTSQRKISLEPTHKMELYENIVHKTHAPVSIFARMSFYTKVALYSFVGMIFLASLYVPYFSSFFHQTDGILTTTPGGAIVQADYIAQIIETKGDIAIYNNGEKVDSKLFRAGDRLVLPAGAEIVFHVTTIAQAKVIGPAEFSVEKNDQGYTIQLLKGKYAEIQSLDPEKEVAEVSKQSVGFRSARVSITPKKTNNIHFTYTEEGQNATIDNQGDTELVVAKIDDSEEQEVLAMHTVAQVGSGKDLLEIGIDLLSGDRKTPVQVAKELAENQQAGAKKMVAGEQHENIKAILASEFLAKDIQQVTTAYLKGQTRDYEIAYINFSNKIIQIYTLMDIAVPQSLMDARSTFSLKVTIQTIEHLLDEMDNHFYVAQTHQVRLKKLLGWLYALREQTFGSYADSELTGNELFNELNLEDYKELIGK